MAARQRRKNPEVAKAELRLFRAQRELDTLRDAITTTGTRTQAVNLSRAKRERDAAQQALLRLRRQRDPRRAPR